MASNWFVLLLVCFICITQGNNNNNDIEHQPLEGFINAFPNANVVALQKALRASASEIKEEDYERVFASCPKLPPAPLTQNVNQLRPGNVKIVMAMGDSITAGMSAKDTTVAVMREYRGLAYSIGSDPTVVTFPNLLQNVSSLSVYGSATGIGDIKMATNGYNAAISGAVNSGMPGQAKWIIDKLYSDPKVNLADDWKVLTIWIGSNNLCAVCDNPTANNGQNFENELNVALNLLYESVPKLFVNLLSVLDVSRLASITSGSCVLLHNIACKCTSDAAKRAIISSTAADYQLRAQNISRNFNGKRDDFAVVVQPFLVDSKITQRSLLSNADCFHPSASCHQALSIALWNNMLTPSDQKKTSWDPLDVPICPDENSLFYTS